MTKTVSIKAKTELLGPKETMMLLERARKGCVESRNELVEANVKLVLNVVHRYKGKEHMFEDLFQIGTIGLIKAIDNFDLGREVRFSTYAVPMILGEIRRHLRDHGNLVKVSRMIQENAAKINAYRERFVAERQREPRLSEIAEGAGIEEEDAVLAVGASNEILSFSKTVQGADGDEIALEERLADKSDWVETLFRKEWLKSAFVALNPKEKIIVKMRYFHEKTQSEIGKELGISQAQVSRIEKNALLKLKKAI